MNYSGIDLHSNNSVVSVIDETDRVVAEKRLPNDLAKILAFLAPWQAELASVVVFQFIVVAAHQLSGISQPSLADV